MSNSIRMRVVKNDLGQHRVESYIETPGISCGWRPVRGRLTLKGEFELYPKTIFADYGQAVAFMNVHYANVRHYEASRNWRPVGMEFTYVA